jgi:hypothetical protein
VNQPDARQPTDREILTSLKERLLGAAYYLMPHDVERDDGGYRLTLSVRVDAQAITANHEPLDFATLVASSDRQEMRVAGFGVTAVRAKDEPDAPWRYYAPGPDGLYRESSRSTEYDPPYRTGTTPAADQAGGP